MTQLSHDYHEFVKRDSEIVAIGPEKPKTFWKYWFKEELPFVGLPDPEHTVLKLYGQRVSLFKLGRMPAQIIVDKEGDIRFIHYGESMKDIPGNEELLKQLDLCLSDG